MTTGLADFAKAIWRHKLMIGAAASGIAYAIFRPFSTLEYTMARVRVASGATVQQIETLNKLATQLGRDTLYSASQAAEGMLYLAKAGMDVQQIYEAIPGVLDAAIVEQLDLGTAADIVTGLLNEFKLSASQAGLAADVLAKGSNLAKTDMVQMSEALKMFGAVAHDMGYSIEESVAMLDVLAGSMIRGTMAGTALRTSMLTFQQLATGKMTGAARDTFKRLGLDVNKLVSGIKAGKIDFLKFAALLRSTGATAGDLANIFEKRTAVAVLTLGDAVNKTFPKLVSALKDAAGYSKEAGDVLEHTLQGQIQQIKSSIETMTNAIAETFAPGIEDFLEHTMRPWVNKITDAWKSAGDTWQEKLKAVTATFAPIMEQGLKALGDKIRELSPSIASSMGDLGATLVPAFLRGFWEGIKQFVPTFGREVPSSILPQPGAEKEYLKGIWTMPSLIRERDITQLADYLQKHAGQPLPEEYQVLLKTLSRMPETFTVKKLALKYPDLAELITPRPLTPFEERNLSLGGTEDTLQQNSLALGKLADATTGLAVDFSHSTDELTQQIDALTNATETNTDAINTNTDSQTKPGGLAQAIGSGLQGLIQKGTDALIGGLEGTLISAITDPLTSTLSDLLAPTEQRVKGVLEQFGKRWFGPLLSIVNVGLDALRDILGVPETRRYRSVAQGAFSYAQGGIARTPQLATLAERGPEIVLPLRGMESITKGLPESATLPVHVTTSGMESVTKGLPESATLPVHVTTSGMESVTKGLPEPPALLARTTVMTTPQSIGYSVQAPVQIGTISVAGYNDGEEVAQVLAEEIRQVQEFASRQLARQIKQGIVKREAMER